jgi:hypothetical protein
MFGITTMVVGWCSTSGILSASKSGYVPYLVYMLLQAFFALGSCCGSQVRWILCSLLGWRHRHHCHW